MGHYSYFCGCTSSDAAFPNGRGQEPLLEAKYYIPLFWLAAFDTADFLLGEEQGEQYAALCCSTASGLERLRRRRDAIVDVVGVRFRALYDEWVQFVASNYPDKLLLQVDDLFSMSDFEEAAGRLRENLEALTPADRGEALVDRDPLCRFTYIEGVNEAPHETPTAAALRSRAIFAGWSYRDTPWPPPPTDDEIAWIDEHTPKDWTRQLPEKVLAHLEEVLIRQVARSWAEAISPLALHILAGRGEGAKVKQIAELGGKSFGKTVRAWLEPEPREPGDRRTLPNLCYAPCSSFGGDEREKQTVALGFVAGREGESAVDELLEEVDEECRFHPALLLLGATWGRGSPLEAWREKLAAPREADIEKAYEEGEISPLVCTAFRLAREMANGVGREAEDAAIAEALGVAHDAASAYVDQALRALDERQRDDDAIRSVLKKLEQLMDQAKTKTLSTQDALPKIGRQACILCDSGGAGEMERIVASLEEIWGPLGALLAPLISSREISAVLDILSSLPSRLSEAAEIELIRSANTTSRARVVAALARDGRDEVVEKVWYPLGRLLNEELNDNEKALLGLVPVMKIAPEAAARLRMALAVELAKVEKFASSVG